MGFSDHSYRAWLPSDVLDRSDLDQALDNAIGRWSTKWFAGAPCRLLPKDPADAIELCWSGISDGLAVGLAPDAAFTIVGAMLGGAPSQGFKEPNDCRVAEALADACLDDLKKRLLLLFRLPGDCEWRGETGPDVSGEASYRTAIGVPPGGVRIDLAISHDLHVARIKTGVSALARAISLGSLEHGLGRQLVDVGARIGGCELSLTELDELGVGDVLVLDQALDSPLELALDGRPVGRRCVIDSTDARLALELVEPVVE